jgi:nitrite reductase/ring-hydroxylating ferredoxin subunit
MHYVREIELMLCAAADVVSGQPITVARDGRNFCICKVDNEYYVLDDLCTHGNASLGRDGLLNGFELVCGHHNGAFDVRTGQPLRRPCIVRLLTYSTFIRSGDLYIRLGKVFG